MRIAVVSDIHGNALALEAVLADLDRRAVDRVVNLGDIASGPLWPRKTMQLLSGRDWTTVRGNHERTVNGKDRAAMGPSDRFALAELDAGHLHWLGGLPLRQDIGHGILAFHATPDDDNVYLVEERRNRELVRSSLADIQRRLGQVAARMVLCGHSHQPHLIQLPDGPLILNPGSVGLPTGSPHARYAIIALEGDRISVEMLALDYPWEAAAAKSEQDGRPGVTHALRTGDLSGLL